MVLEERVARIEGIIEQIEKRLNHIEGEIRDIRNEIREVRKDLNYRFFWLLGVLISMWITIILTILFT
jgi:DNA-binding FrmR family transcriptional regulator